MADVEKLEKTQKFVMRTLMLSAACSLLLALGVAWGGISELFRPGGSVRVVQISAVVFFLLSAVAWLSWRVSGELYRGDLEGPRTVRWALVFGIPLPFSFGTFMLGEATSGSGDSMSLLLAIPALAVCALLIVSILRVLFGSALDDLVWVRKESELEDPDAAMSRGAEPSSDAQFDFGGASAEREESSVEAPSGERGL